MRVEGRGTLVCDDARRFKEESQVRRRSQPDRSGHGAEFLGGHCEVGETEIEQSPIDIAICVSDGEFEIGRASCRERV